MENKKKNEEINCDLAIMDLGNYNLTNNKRFLFEHRWILDNDRDPVGQQVLEVNDNRYFMGIGTFVKDYNKAERDILPGLLYSLGTSFKDKDLNLILGLPASMIGLKQNFIDQLKDKTILFKLNGKERVFHFHNVGVTKEGFSAYYALPTDKRKGRVTIIDIGGRTVNVACFVDGREELSTTIGMGTINYFEQIANSLQGEGKNIKLENIRSFLNNGLDLDKYESITSRFAKELLNELQLKRPELYMDKIFVCGGGADFFIEDIKIEFAQSEIMEDPLYANVEGNEQIGELLGWKTR